MNDETHAFWLAYIRQLADGLDLRDWDIWLARQDPDTNGAWAANFVFYGQRRCEIRIALDNFLNQRPERQRYLLVHELLHCHSEPVAEVVRVYRKGADDDKTQLFEQFYDRQFELFLDSIATAIAPFFPLPEAT